MRIVEPYALFQASSTVLWRPAERRLQDMFSKHIDSFTASGIIWAEILEMSFLQTVKD